MLPGCSESERLMLAEAIGPPREYARNLYGHMHDVADTLARPSKRCSGFIKHLGALLDVGTQMCRRVIPDP